MAGNAARCAHSNWPCSMPMLADAKGDPIGQVIGMLSSRLGNCFVPRGVPGPVQRGDHGRGSTRKEDDFGLEDVDLWVPSGEGQGGRRRGRTTPPASRSFGESSAGGWTSGSTRTRRGRPPSWSDRRLRRSVASRPFGVGAAGPPCGSRLAEPISVPRLGVPVMLDESLVRLSRRRPGGRAGDGGHLQCQAVEMWRDHPGA